MNKLLEDMIEYDLKGRGISGRVLEAFRKVDRAKFVPEYMRDQAYDDRALQLTHGQTISQPYMVATMLQALQLEPRASPPAGRSSTGETPAAPLAGPEKVLEVGTGSGYQTALLAVLCREVWTVERLEPLATSAEDRLVALGYTNIRCRLGDGSLGWPEGAPYDRIIVSAACPALPPALVAQLAEGGLIAAPVGPPEGQELVVGRKHGGKLDTRREMACIFVRLIGAQGYPEWEGNGV